MNKEIAWLLGYLTYNRYSNIKDKIKGYERHFIRGLWDADGAISIRHRNGIAVCRVAFINKYPQITEWVAKTISDILKIPLKKPRYTPQSHVWEIQWEGTIGRIIVWWLYHGDIKHCCLARKREKYLKEILDSKKFESRDEEILYAAKASREGSYIKINKPSSCTLKWCHILQRCLSFNTVPVFHNPGKRKYYNLYIPSSVANTQDMQVKNCMKA